MSPDGFLQHPGLQRGRLVCQRNARYAGLRLILQRAVAAACARPPAFPWQRGKHQQSGTFSGKSTIKRQALGWWILAPLGLKASPFSAPAHFLCNRASVGAAQGRRVIHIKRATPSSSFINPGTELPRRTGRGAPAPTKASQRMIR